MFYLKKSPFYKNFICPCNMSKMQAQVVSVHRLGKIATFQQKSRRAKILKKTLAPNDIFVILKTCFMDFPHENILS